MSTPRLARPGERARLLELEAELQRQNFALGLKGLRDFRPGATPGSSTLGKGLTLALLRRVLGPRSKWLLYAWAGSRILRTLMARRRTHAPLRRLKSHP